MRWRALTAWLVLAAMAAGSVLAWMAAADRRFAGRAMPGVRLEGTEVGDLEPAALRARIEAAARATLARPVAVHAGPAASIVPAGELGLRPAVDRTVDAILAAGRSGPWWERLRDRGRLLRGGVDVGVQYRIDAERAREAVRRMAAGAAVPPRDAVVDVTGGRLVVVTPSQDGVVLDEPSSVGRLAAALARGDLRADLVVTPVPPALTTEIADRMREPVARFTTVFPYNPDRIHNIRLAAAALQGVLLPPDAVLSYNERVGRRDAARGYRKAPVLINNILVPGDGGGVCQVSSTLFYAGLLADLKVEARTNHSRPVPYMPAGLDATVEYGLIDLRLRNTTGAYLYVWTAVGRRTMTVTLFGTRSPDRAVSVVMTDPVVVPAPTHTVTRRDPDLPAGETTIDPPRSGLRIRTLRIVSEGGVVVRREEVTRSYYQPTPRTIRTGTGASNGAPRAAAP